MPKWLLIPAALSLFPPVANAETCVETSNNMVNPERVQTAEAINKVFVDPVYATDRNFTGKPLKGYDAQKVWIQPETLDVLKADTPQMQERLAAALESKGMDRTKAREEAARYFYLIKDGYRPYRATVDMNDWRKEVNSDSNPSNNVGSGWIAGEISNHNRGYTVDRTLVRKMEDGSIKEVWMGSHFDEFDPNSYLKAGKESTQIVNGRQHEVADDKFAFGGSYFVNSQMRTAELRSILAAAPGSDYWMEWWHTTTQSGGICYDRPIQ